MRALKEWLTLIVLAVGFGGCVRGCSHLADAQAERVARGNLSMRGD